MRPLLLLLGLGGASWWVKSNHPQTADHILVVALRAANELGRRIAAARDGGAAGPDGLRRPAAGPAPPPQRPGAGEPQVVRPISRFADAIQAVYPPAQGRLSAASDGERDADEFFDDDGAADADFDETFEDDGAPARRPAAAVPVAEPIPEHWAVVGPSGQPLEGPSYATLPETACLIIFAQLAVDDRLRCEEVCAAWRRLVRRPAVWQRIDVNGMAAAARLLPRHIIRLVQRSSGITREGEPTHLLRTLLLPRRAEALTAGFLKDILRHSGCSRLRDLHVGPAAPAQIHVVLEQAPSVACVRCELLVSFAEGDPADRIIAAARTATELCAHARVRVQALVFQSAAGAAGPPLQLPTAAWTACGSAVLALASRGWLFDLRLQSLAVHNVFVASITAARPLCHLIRELSIASHAHVAPDCLKLLDLLGDHLSAPDCTLRSLKVAVINFPEGDKPEADMGDDFAFLLAALADNTSLRELEITSRRPRAPQLRPSEGSFMEAISTMLSANRTLRRLVLSNLALTARPPPAEALTEDEDRERLGEALRHNTTLRELRLRGVDLADGRASEAVASALESAGQLARLELSGCGLKDDGAHRLAVAIKANGSLRALRVLDNQLSRRGARALLDALRINRRLRELVIDQDNESIDPNPDDEFTAGDTLRAAADALRFNLALRSLEVTPVTVDDSSLARLYRAEIHKQLAVNNSRDRAQRLQKRKQGVKLLTDGIQRDVVKALQVGAGTGLRAGEALGAALRALQETGYLATDADWAACFRAVQQVGKQAITSAGARAAAAGPRPV